MHRIVPGEMKQAAAALGKRGGKARAKKLSPERRREIAIKASKAAAKARRKKAGKEK